MNKLIILIVFVTAIVEKIKSHENNTAKNELICKDPKKDSNFDPVWLDENTPPFGMHIIMGSLSAKKHLFQLLQGREAKKNDDLSGMCATSFYSNSKTQVAGQIRGFESLSATRNCTNCDGDIYCEFVSIRNPDYKESAKIYVAHFGEKSYLNFEIVVYCFSNGEVGWVVSAIRKSITAEESAFVLQQLNLLGFDGKDNVPIYTPERCDYVESKSIWFPSGLWHKERQDYYTMNAKPPQQQPGHGWTSG